MATGGGQPEPQPEPPRPSPFGAFRLTGILAASLIALVLGVATFAQRDDEVTTGGGGGSGQALTREALADEICDTAQTDLPRRPESRGEAITAARERALVLSTATSGLQNLGADDLAIAMQRWVDAEVRLSQSLRGGRAELASAARAVRTARRRVARVARKLPATRCVRLARRGQM